MTSRFTIDLCEPRTLFSGAPELIVELPATVAADAVVVPLTFRRTGSLEAAETINLETLTLTSDVPLSFQPADRTVVIPAGETNVSTVLLATDLTSRPTAPVERQTLILKYTTPTRSLATPVEIAAPAPTKEKTADEKRTDDLAQLEKGLGILLQAWKGDKDGHGQNRSPDLAKVIQATMIEINRLNDAHAALINGVIGAVRSSVKDTLAQLGEIGDIGTKVDSVKDALDAVKDIPDGASADEITQRIQKLGTLGKQFSELLEASPAAKALDRLNAVGDLLGSFQTAANSDLNPGNIVRGMGELIGSIRSILPKFSGVNELLGFYENALGSIGNAIDQINGMAAKTNLDAWALKEVPGGGQSTANGATFGTRWADVILEGAKPSEIPTSPLEWGFNEIPDAWKGYLPRPDVIEGDPYAHPPTDVPAGDAPPLT